MNDTTKAAIEANRKRYDELKVAGQNYAPRDLPPPTAVDGVPLANDTILHREAIPGGWYWTGTLALGETLRIVNIDGRSSVALIAWNSRDRSERLNYADTVKVQWSATIRKGRVLLSDMGRVFFAVTEDTSFGHDTLAGGSTAATALAKFGPGHARNTRDNFVIAAAKLGLDRRDIPPSISFFAPVSVADNGRLVFRGDQRKPGDFVDLRAEMKLDVVISNCAHPLDPLAIEEPAAVEVIRFRTLELERADLCRNATAEAIRAYENTDALVAMQAQHD